MQASKIELHHQVYAVRISETDATRLANAHPGLRPGIFRAVVTRIVTDRHENGPNGMVQTVRVNFMDHIDSGVAEAGALDPKVVLGKWDQYEETIKAKEEAQRRDREAANQRQRYLGRVYGLLQAAGFTKMADNMVSRGYGRVDSFRPPSLGENDLPALVAIFEAAGHRMPDEPTTLPERE